MNRQTSSFTHIDSANNPAMVDVGDKAVTKRTATAQSIVTPGSAVMQQLSNGEIHTKKGPVFHTAIIAGTMAAKRTAELIPFCHPLGMERCNITITISEANELVVQCTVAVTAKTGVEMEALTGASVAALTIYDMCKAISHDIVIREIKLIQKTGGKTDYAHGA